MSLSDTINEIMDTWLKEAKSLAGSTVKESLDLLSNLLFIEPGQFILEMLQNAEDARMELKKRNGYFSITLTNNEVIIKHDGKPFDSKDLRSLCRVGSYKKPREGYKGYMGIGFKSVFRISSKVYVHSNNPQLGDIAFKFDRDHWHKREVADQLEKTYGLNPSEVPYQVVPILVEPTEYLKLGETIFRIQLDNPSKSQEVRMFLERIPNYMFLFLEFINKVVIEDKVRNYNKTIEWITTPLETVDDDIRVEKVILSVNNKAEKFLVFKKLKKVPDEVKKDEVTINAKRSDVDVREIAIAFALDEHDNPKPVEGAEFWGVYSFMPLPESSSGLRFLIQADLIVHPGRRSVNYEALWNLWIMERIANLIKKVIKYMSERYGSSYLPVFEYRNIGGPFYEKLIKPYIVRVIEEELKDPLIPCIKGQLVPLSKAVIYDEGIRDLIEGGLITEKDLRHIYNETDLCLVSPDVKLRPQDRVRRPRAEDLLNKDLIEAKFKEDQEKVFSFLIKVYEKVKVPRDENKRFIITKVGNIVTAHNAYIGNIPDEVTKLAKQYPEINEFLQKLNYVHEHLLEGLGVEFLKELGVKEVKFQEVCSSVFLPKLTANKPLKKEEVLMISAILKKAGVKPTGDIWVVTHKGEVKRSSEVYYPYEHFKPLELLEKLGFDFLNIDEYTRYDSEDEWYRFFEFVPMKGKKPNDSWGYLNPDYRYLLDRIKEVLSSSSDRNELITYTRLLKRLYMKLKDYLKDWKLVVNVLTDEEIRRSDEAFLHSRYDPKEDWMKWKEFCGVGPFVSDEYIDDGDIQGWREFFVNVLSVKEEATSEQVERFAEEYVKDKLVKRGYKILRSHEKGFDYEAKMEGSSILVEVKGRKKTIDEIEINLTEAETHEAYEHKENYWIAVVVNIPNSPTLYIIKDPTRAVREVVIKGKHLKEELKKLVEVWS